MSDRSPSTLNKPPIIIAKTIELSPKPPVIPLTEPDEPTSNIKDKNAEDQLRKAFASNNFQLADHLLESQLLKHVLACF